jgi:hypothetical protein
MTKITYDDKSNQITPTDPDRQVTAEDLNEIKESVNDLYDGENDNITTERIPYKSSTGIFASSPLYYDVSENKVVSDVTFEVPGGTIKIGEATDLSASTGEVIIRNLVDDTISKVIIAEFDSTGSDKPQYLDLETQFQLDIQTDYSEIITTNPLSYSITGTVTSPKKRQLNVMYMKTNGAMTNARVRFTDNATGVVIRYLPDKAAWESGTDGMDLVAGDNEFNLLSTDADTAGVFNLGVNPFIVENGQQIDIEVEADNMDLLGLSSVPYQIADVQDGYVLNVIVEDENGNVSVSGDVNVEGDVVVGGTITSSSTENLLVTDNHILLNNGYTAAVAKEGGVVVNYLPTATADTVSAGAFVAGIAATSNPTVGTVGAAVFANNDIVMFHGSVENDGLYEVSSHAANLLTVKGVGTIPTVEGFTNTQFVANASDSCTITKVTVSVMCSDTDGVWRSGKGAVTPITFSDIVDLGDIGNDTNILFNDSGSIGSDDNFNWDKETLDVNGAITQDIVDPVTQLGKVTNISYTEASKALAVFGGYAYLISRQSVNDYIAVIDVSNPASPATVSRTPDTTVNDPEDIQISGDYLYVVSSGNSTFAIFNLVLPLEPVLIGSVTDVINLNGVASVFVEGRYAYVTSSSANTLCVIDILDRANPSIIGVLNDATNLNGANGVHVIGDFAFVCATDNGSLTSVDISDKTSPTFSYALTDTSLTGANKVVAEEGNAYAYVTGSTNNYLSIVDISDPELMTVYGSVQDAFALNGAYNLVVIGNYAYVTSIANDLVTTVNITNRANPSVLGYYENATDLEEPYALAASDGKLYTSGFVSDTFNVLDLHGTSLTTLDVGDIRVDTADIYDNLRVGGAITTKSTITADSLFVGTSVEVADGIEVRGGDIVVDTDTFIVDASTERVGINKVPTTALDVDGTATATTFSGDLNGTINTATTGTTQSQLDNSTKIATTAYVDTAVSVEDHWYRDVPTTTLEPQNSGDNIGTSGWIRADNGFYIGGDLILDWQPTAKTISLGEGAGLSITSTGLDSVFIGRNAGTTTSTGDQNIAIGFDSLYTNSTGDNNIAIGSLALYTADTADDNTAIGYEALRYATGANNTALGALSGTGVTTGSGNITIGYDAEVADGTASNQISIGNTIYRNSAGNVGIGLSTPKVTLDVAGTSASGRSLQVRSGEAGTGTDSAQIIMSYNGASYDNVGYGHSIRTRHSGINNYNNAIDFWLWNTDTASSSTLGDERVMTLTGDGRVGIGTGSPEYPLHISHASAGYALIETDSNSGDTGLLFRNSVGENAYVKGGIFFKNDGAGFGRGDLHFALENTATDSNVDVTDAIMTILHEGYVGIGETDPDTNLHVKGAASPTQQLKVERANDSSGAAQMVLYHSTASPAASDGAGLINFNLDNSAAAETTFGRIDVTSDDVTDATEDATMTLQTISDGTLATRMSIDGDGSTLSRDLTVNGTIYPGHDVYGYMENGTTGFAERHISTGVFSSDTISLTATGTIYSAQWGRDGTRLFVTTDDAYIYQYNLTVPYDISTATYQGSNSFTDPDNTGSFTLWNDDGTVFWHGGRGARTITLTSAWDISSIASDVGFSPSFRNPFHFYDLKWNSDGTKVLGVGYFLDDLVPAAQAFCEWECTTPYDFTTKTAQDSNVYEFPTGVPDTAYIVKGFDISPDGKRVYLSAPSTGIEYEVVLETAWDMSSSTLVSTVTRTEHTDIQNIAMIPDGSGFVSITSAGTIVQKKFGLAVDGNIEAYDLTLTGALTQDNTVVPTLEDALIDNTNFDGINALHTVGKYAYAVSFDADSFSVISLEDPSSLVRISTLTNGTDLNGPYGIHAVGNYAYIGTYNSGELVIIDISDKSSPTIVGQGGSGGGYGDLFVAGQYCYITDYDGHAIEVINVADSTNPISVTDVDGDGMLNPTLVHAQGNYLYCTSLGDHALHIYDISDPTAIFHVGKYTSATYINQAWGLAISGQYCYVTGRAGNSVTIIDVSDPSTPSYVGSYVNATNLNGPKGVYLSGDLLYVACDEGKEVTIIDVSDPTSPSFVNKLTDATNLDGCHAVELSDGYAYAVSDNSNSICSIDIQGAKLTSMSAGTMEVNRMHVLDDATVAGQLDVTSSMIIGENLNVHGTATADGGQITTERQDYNQTTGWLFGGQVTVNGGDNTLIDVAAGTIRIVDYATDTTSRIPEFTTISWTAQTALDPGTFGRSIWVGVKDNGSGVATFTYNVGLTPAIMRDNGILCRLLSNTGDGQISSVLDFERPAWGLTNALQDWILQFGSYTIEGNKFTPNDTNLLFDRGNGTTNKTWRYHTSDVKGEENVHTETAGVGITAYNYHLQGSDVTTLETDIDPDNIDVSGTKTAMTSDYWSIQEIWYFPTSGTTHVLYGQVEYDSIAAAIIGLDVEDKVRNTEILDGAIFRTYVIIQEGSTDLDEAVIIQEPVIGKPSRGQGRVPQYIAAPYSMGSNPGTDEFYLGGFYEFATTSVTLTIGGTVTQTFGNVNDAKGAHAFCVASGATIGSNLVLTVSGTSITDTGVRTTSDSEVLVTNAGGTLSNDYFETEKKWLGQILFTLTGTSGAFAFNYGFAAYEDFANRDFRFVDVKIEGLASSTTSDLNFEVIPHIATGWTYASTNFQAGSTPIISMSTDYSTDVDITSDGYFRWKRTNQSTIISGTTSEGILIRGTQATINAIRFANAQVGVLI